MYDLFYYHVVDIMMFVIELFGYYLLFDFHISFDLDFL